MAFGVLGSGDYRGFLALGVFEKRRFMTMNVETETFTKDTQPLIPLQPPPRDKTCHFLSTGKYLSLLRDCGYSWWEVWKMKPEEDSGEWRKMHACKIDLSPGDGDVKCRRRSKFGELIPLGWVKYLEILALTGDYCHRTCVFYNLVTQETDAVEIPKCYKGFAHRNNLAWLR